MKYLLKKRIVILCLVMLMPIMCRAANHYIRDGASGDGSDWTNAWDDFPATMIRGDTYYVADGIYSADDGSDFSFNDSESGSTRIVIKKATEAEHGTEIGWVSTYGDGQAEFLVADGADHASRLEFKQGYYTFDGVVGGGPYDWDTEANFGFKITGPTDGDISSDTKLIHLDPTGSDNVIISHVYFASAVADDSYGYNYAILSNLTGSGMGDGQSWFGPENLTVSYCYFEKHHVHIAGASINGWVIEYCMFEESRDDIEGGAYQAGSFYTWSSGDLTLRYNIWKNISGTGIIVHKSNQVGNPTRRNIDNKVYGNVFYQDSETILGVAAGMFTVSDMEPYITDTWENLVTGSARVGPTASQDNSGGYTWTPNWRGHLHKMQLDVAGVHTVGEFTAQVYDDAAGSPGNTVGSASAALNITGTGTAEFVFGTPVPISMSTKYWIVFTADGTGDCSFNYVANVESVESGTGDAATSINDNLTDNAVFRINLTEWGVVTGLRFYNNTIVGVNNGETTGGLEVGVHLEGSDMSDNLVYNNLWYNCEQQESITSFFDADGYTGVTNDYNWYYEILAGTYGNEANITSALVAAEGVNSQEGSGNPLTAWQNKDFSLSAATDAGIYFLWMNNKDMFGRIRGSDGVWDRGAFEYDPGQVVIIDPGPDPQPTTYQFTISINGNGTVTKTPDKTEYNSGESVTIQAIPDFGYAFTSWSGDVESEENPITIIMDANKSISAQFEETSGVEPEADEITATQLYMYNNVIKSGQTNNLTMSVDIKEPCHLSVNLYDSKGKKIKEFYNEHKNTGNYPLIWDGTNMDNKKAGSGIYMLHVEAGGYKETKKIAVIK